jgi:hypothetical protein
MLDEHRERLEEQEADSGKATGASSKKRSETPTKGSPQKTSQTTSPRQGDEGATAEKPAEEAEGDGTASTTDEGAHDEAFEDGAADDDLPF